MNPSLEADGTCERSAHANVTIDVFLVGKPRTHMSSFEPRG